MRKMNPSTKRSNRAYNARKEAGLKTVAGYWYDPENPRHLKILRTLKQDEMKRMGGAK